MNRTIFVAGIYGVGKDYLCDKISETTKIKKNTNISANDIANILSKSSRTIQRAIATLKETNRIKRVGPDKGGHWEICK